MIVAGDYCVQREDKVAAWVTRRSFERQGLGQIIKGLLRSPDFRPVLLATAVAMIGLLLDSVIIALVPLAAAAAWVLYQMRGETLAFSARHDGQLVGGLRGKLNRRQNTLSLSGLYVLPEHRQRGLASALFAEAFEQAATLTPDGRIIAYASTHPATYQLVFKHMQGKEVIVGSERYKQALSRYQG